MAKTSPGTPSSPGFKGKTPVTMDVEKIIELANEHARLKLVVSNLKKEIPLSQKVIDDKKIERDKIKDKRKAEYKTLDNEIGLLISRQIIQQDLLKENVALLREIEKTINNVGNIAASKNLPPRATPEELDKAKKEKERKEKEEERVKKEKEEKDKIDAEKKEALVLLRRLSKGDTTLTAEEKQLAFKYEDELTSKIDDEDKKEKAEAKKKKDIRTKIAETLSKDGEAELETAEKIHLMKDGEAEEVGKVLSKLNKEQADKIQKEEDDKKAVIQKEQEKQNTINIIVNILVLDNKITNPDQEKFYTENKADIDAKVLKAKEELLNTQKASVLEKLSEETALTAEEQKIYNTNKSELDAKIVDVLKTKLAAARTASDTTLITKYETAIESRLRLSKKTMEDYEPLIKRFTENTKHINELEAKSKLSVGQQQLLNDLKQEKNEIYASLDKFGPSGRGFADLEVARNDLAKTSQEFNKTFKSKYFGAKIVGVFAGMFGSKWSAVKETEATAGAQAKMTNARYKYDKIRENLMNVFIGEEYAVREAFGQDLKNLNPANEVALNDFINSIGKKFIDDEYQNLEKAKNILEGTVRGSAMRRFGQWYSQGGPYKNIKNPVLRKVLNRVTSGLVLSSAIFLLPGVGAGAAFGSYLGYRATRAAVSGTVGESAALGVATLYGGKLNDKGEFTKFAKTRDEEFAESRRKFVQLMSERRGKEEKSPLVTPTMMQTLNQEHAKTISNYMNSQGNARRAEMWTRIIAGGATAAFMTQLIPNPTTINPNPIVVPKPDNFSEPRVVVDTDHVNHGGGMRAPIENHLNDNEIPKEGILDLDNESGPKLDDTVLPDPASDKLADIDNSASDAIDQKIALYKQYSDPGSEGDFYRSRGLDVMGKELGTRGQITQVNDGTISYYVKGYEHLARGNGDWRPLEDAPFYKEYHLAHDNYLNAQDQIKTLEADKIKLKIDALQDNNPNTGSVEDNIDNSPKAATGNIETKIIPETPEQHTDKLVDQIYGHDTGLGHESGVDSQEWQSVKDMPANKFLRNYRTNIDDTYANTKYDIPEQNKFADTILEKAEKYNMKPKAGGLFSNAETLEHFVDRISKAELENKTQSSK